jgi:hypothetical protein
MLCRQQDLTLPHLTLTMMATLMPSVFCIQDMRQSGVERMHMGLIIRIEFGHTNGLSTRFPVGSGQAIAERVCTITTSVLLYGGLQAVLSAV